MTTVAETMGIDDCCDFVLFNEYSGRNNPMGNYRNKSVFAADGYREAIQYGHAYYCKLINNDNKKKGQFYNAIPIYELTIERIMEEYPDLIPQIAEFIYNQDRTKFDSEISAIQMREIKEEAVQKYVKKINRLEKDNERLQKELSTHNENIQKEQVLIMSTETSEHLDGNMFYSDKLEDRYYSVRLNIRKDMALLMKDDNGQFGGHGHSMDISDIVKMLGAKKVKTEYCHKYRGVVITKKE